MKLRINEGLKITDKQQEIIDTFLEDVKYALEVAFEECDETYTHIDLDIPKSLDDDTLWQGIWETMEDNGISYTVKHKNTKFNYNYYYVYIHYYNTENVFGRIGERMKKYVKSTIIESSIQVSGYDDASRKLKALSDGEIIQYTGNKLGGVVEAVANALEVGDEFTISAEVGYIAPGPDNDGTRTITTTFLVTDAYRYGNGYAPIYQGRSPQLNANQSRRWRDITNGALWLLGNREYTIVIHKSSQSITSATL